MIFASELVYLLKFKLSSDLILYSSIFFFYRKINWLKHKRHDFAIYVLKMYIL